MINNKTMNIMRKQLLTPKAMRKAVLYTCALFAFASCADNSYVGPETGENGTGGGAISFGYELPSITRAEFDGKTAAEKLKYRFKVFGVKSTDEGDQSETDDQRVFATASTGVTPYWVWFVENTENNTSSNSSGWEYVGAKNTEYGTTGNTVTLGDQDQTIKFWDYSAKNYYFQAWSDVNTYGDNVTKLSVDVITKKTMKITATPTQLASFYLADLKTYSNLSASKPTEVQFTFRTAATKVRLGIYETVPGYSVRNIKFYYTPKSSTETSSNASSSAASHATLTGKFVGASNSTATSFTVTYEGTPLKAVIKPSNPTTNTEHFDFGTIGSNDASDLGTTSTSPTWAGGSADYISVFPNTDANNIANMTLKVDYDLYNSGSGEVINVTGKTAVVPAAYMTWKPNYAYTYLFKITDDQLTPITLDAVVVEDGEGNQETITTVPSEGKDVSITTYAEGSNITTNNEYKAGATIFASFMQGVNELTPVNGTEDVAKANYVKVYSASYYGTPTDAEKTSHPITEVSVADAIANSGGLITATEITSTNYSTYLNAAPSVDGKKLKLEGVKAGYYAVEIVTYPQVTSPTGNPSTSGYYELSTDTYSQSTDTSVDTNKTYYKQVKTYKVIKVSAAS